MCSVGCCVQTVVSRYFEGPVKLQVFWLISCLLTHAESLWDLEHDVWPPNMQWYQHMYHIAETLTPKGLHTATYRPHCKLGQVLYFAEAKAVGRTGTAGHWWWERKYFERPVLVTNILIRVVVNTFSAVVTIYTTSFNIKNSTFFQLYVSLPEIHKTYCDYFPKRY